MREGGAGRVRKSFNGAGCGSKAEVGLWVSRHAAFSPWLSVCTPTCNSRSRKLCVVGWLLFIDLANSYVEEDTGTKDPDRKAEGKKPFCSDLGGSDSFATGAQSWCTLSTRRERRSSGWTVLASHAASPSGTDQGSSAEGNRPS